MPRRLPDFRMHDDGGVEAHDILAAANGELPPRILDIALELAPERPVVPEAGHAAVYLGRMVYETPALGQRAERVQRRFVF